MKKQSVGIGRFFFSNNPFATIQDNNHSIKVRIKGSEDFLLKEGEVQPIQLSFNGEGYEKLRYWSDYKIPCKLEIKILDQLVLSCIVKISYFGNSEFKKKVTFRARMEILEILLYKKK